MGRRSILPAALVAIGVVVNATDAVQAPRPSGREIVRRVAALTRASVWTLAASVPLDFPAHHPQGLVKIGDTFHMTAVDVAGLGYLFKFDASGRLIASITLGEGQMYHPGGIDYDGRSIWVTVAEYRPDSRSIVYRVDPGTLKAAEVFRFADHLGAIVHNTDDHTLHAVSWGSRRFYRWPLGRDGRPTNLAAPPAALRTLNRSHYVDYQDCKYAGARRMVCTGVTEIRGSPATAAKGDAAAGRFRLGGIDVVNLEDGRPEYQVPVNVWTTSGLVITQNPVWLEPHGEGLRAYVVPEDDKATLYIYDVR
ncbi:MAG TPA: DUF6454 family protein [Vicinamibacterales bacterium]|nr:DUF6454 family protein [Vicinamibacterales bacterium]